MLMILFSFNQDGDLKNLGAVILIVLGIIVAFLVLVIGGLVYAFLAWKKRKAKRKLVEKINSGKNSNQRDSN